MKYLLILPAYLIMTKGHGALPALHIEFPHSHLRQPPCPYNYCLVFLNKDNDLFGKTEAFI